MSDSRRYLGESDEYSTNDFRHSRNYTPNENLNRDAFLNSLSQYSPNENSKAKSSRISSEQEKASREKRKLEKDNAALVETIKKLEMLNENLRKENLKLRASFEKSEYQKNGFSNMLQKLNEDCKQKSEQIKKHVDHIKKLESQLLMGSLHHNLYEENKRLKENISNIEEDNKEKSEKIIELSERLVRSANELEMYKSAAEVNLIEINEQMDSGNKVSMEDLVSYLEGRTELDALRNENEQLKKMLNESEKSVENLSGELERQQNEIEEHQKEVTAYENALESSDKEVKKLQKDRQELLEKERLLNDKVNMLQEELVQSKAQVDKEVKKTRENYEKYVEKLLHENDEVKERLEEAEKQNEEYRHVNLELENLVKEINERLNVSEKEKQEILESGNVQELQEELEIKERVLKDKNAQMEQLVGKIKGFDREMRELYNKNVKQEETIAKYQEIIEFSQSFIQKMEQKFYTILSEDQNSKNLKVEIHKLIESCIKRMLSNAS